EGEVQEHGAEELHDDVAVVGQALDAVLHALLGGILGADTGVVGLPEEPGAVGEAVLFTRWRSDCLGCVVWTRSRLQIYWCRRPIRSGSLSEVVREYCNGVMVSFSRPRQSERIVMGYSSLFRGLDPYLAR